MHGLQGRLRIMFVAFEQRDFRYLALSTLSLGTAQWAQQIGLTWLALQMTGSAIEVGIVSAFSAGPGVIAAPIGGYLADRFRRRTVLVWTTAASAIQAAMLAVLIVTGLIELWQLYALAIAGGILQAITQPARQAFVYDVSTDETLATYRELDVHRVILGPGRARWDEPDQTFPFLDRYAELLPALA